MLEFMSITIVTGDAAFGDGFTYVFHDNEISLMLESDEERAGFLNCLEFLSLPYQSIDIDHDNYDLAEEWGANVSIGNLDYLLESASENDMTVTVEDCNSDESEPVRVSYLGFDSRLLDLMSQPEFAEVLEQNSFAMTDSAGQMLDYSQISPQETWVFDTVNEVGMPIIYDGIAAVVDPSAGFQKILELMDAKLKEDDQMRLFVHETDEGEREAVDSTHEKFDSEFDFSTGKYV